MMLQIGELSRATGIPEKTIRYYEDIKLLPPARRAQNGYRIYGDSDVERLRFIRRARDWDFTLDEIAELLAFRGQPKLPCDHLLNTTRAKIGAIEARIRDLERLRDELLGLFQSGQKLPINPKERDCICQQIQTDFVIKGNLK
jgi:DNA-binding transcriptional MerR regulator